MKNVTLFLIAILLAGIACKPKQARDETVTIFGAPTRSEEELARLVFEKGCDSAYHELKGAYYLGSYKFLVYALYMANKYDYLVAYYDVYERLALICRDRSDNGMYYQLDRLDETTRQMALDYLQKAYKRGDIRAASTLGEYYMEGKYFKKDTLLGKKLLMEARKPQNTEGVAQ